MINVSHIGGWPNFTFPKSVLSAMQLKRKRNRDRNSNHNPTKQLCLVQISWKYFIMFGKFMWLINAARIKLLHRNQHFEREIQNGHSLETQPLRQISR
jgi:hypothetical protein